MSDKVITWETSSRALRDGTSQADRHLPALDTSYAQIDERSVEDLLQFAKRYAREINFFNEYNETDGDWQAFMAMDVHALAQYLESQDKERFAHDIIESAAQPHRALFLTFIKLVAQVQSRLNDYTRRHLEFYYRKILQLARQEPQPDYVHCLFTLAHNVNQFRLPVNTRIAAGKDSAGKPLIYTTDDDILINRAEVAYLKSVYVDQRHIELRHVQQQPDLLVALEFPIASLLKTIDKQVDRSVMAMLSMALGDPLPGGALPNFTNTQPVTVALLDNVDTVLAFISNELYLTLPQFHLLMQLKADVNEPSGWLRVNDYLTQAARNRLGDPNFQLPQTDPEHFEKNLMNALGVSSLENFFAGLPEVEDIYDMYGRWDRPDVKPFIEEKLFLPINDFKAMITIAYDYLVIWRRLYSILQSAGRRKQRKHPSHKLTKPNIQKYEKNKFDKLVERTLGALNYGVIQGVTVSNLDQCYTQIQRLEAYFFSRIENVAILRRMHHRLRQQEQLKDWEWREIFRILQSIRQEKEASRRLIVLREKLSQGIDAMIRFALGDPDPGDPLPDNKTLSTINPETDQSYIQSRLHMDVINFKHLQRLSAQSTLSDDDMTHLTRIVEQAQRRKRMITASTVSIDQWRNIYAYEDATTVQAQPHGNDQSVTPHWHTFGEASLNPIDEPSAVGRLGLAISSPILLLSEGIRTLYVSFAMDGEKFDQASIHQLLAAAHKPFQFLLSTEKEMIEVDYEVNTARDHVPQSGYNHALVFKLTLGPEQPPIVPLTSADENLSSWPQLHLMLADVPDETDPEHKTVKHYRLFKDLKLTRVHITVDVKGLSSSQLQNDQGTLNPKKPFDPFGSTPAIGSRFYIAHPEFCEKKLDHFRLAIDWQGVPDDLNNHYLGYKGFDDPTPSTQSPFADNQSITAKIILNDRRRDIVITQAPLFHANPNNKTQGATKRHTITVKGSALSTALPDYGYITSALTGKDITTWQRYWKLELQQDLRHAIYPRVAAMNASRMNGDTPNPYIVNQPYTPTVNTLTIEYRASTEWLSDMEGNQPTSRLEYLEPFGCREICKDSTGRYSFLPPFNHEGTLYIGIKNLNQSQTLTLLCQVADGSANPDLVRPTPEWDYLSDDQWIAPPEGLIIQDNTDGLIKSGVIQLKTPAAKKNQLLSDDAYWLRVRVPDNTKGIANMIAIGTQAVKATLTNDNYAMDHYTKPLAPDSIKNLEIPQPQIKSVSQPYSSVGGRGEEVASHFNTRVSERLRHKNRALTSWDYEHLVLENFSDIYKVKCLPVGSSQDPHLNNLIQVVVIPNIKNKFPFDPFAPKVPADRLVEIERFLVTHSSPMAQILVKNPKYIQLQVRCGIRFLSDTDTRYNSQLLNEEITRFLSPWAYDNSADIVLGGSLNASLIINMIEQLPYVDYVAGINLFISTDGVNFKAITQASGELDNVDIELPEAVVVSAKEHVIDVIGEEHYEEAHFNGINYMRIEFDFQVASD